MARWVAGVGVDSRRSRNYYRRMMATAQARAKGKTFRRGLGVVIALACLLLIATACNSNASQPEAVPSASPHAPRVHAIVGRIVIPKLGIDEPMVTGTVNPDGVMETPSEARGVFWYNFSARPGETGNIVVAGLLYHYTGTAVFAALEELVAGDTITLLWEDGREYRYRVISYEVPTDPQARLESVIGSTDQNVITLIGALGATGPGPRPIVRAELVS